MSGGRRARSGEEGETLIELLLAIVMLGTAIVVIIAGIFTATASSAVARERTKVSVFLQAWAEDTLAPAWVDAGGDSELNYAPCDAPPSGLPSGDDLPDGWTVSWTVRYVATTGSPPEVADWGSPSWVDQGSCSTYTEVDPISGESILRDGRLQQITLVVTTAPGSRQTTDSLTVLKRDPRCHPQYDNADLGPC